MTTQIETARIYVNTDLMKQIKKQYSETKGMTYTGLVEWALRLLLKNAKEA